MSASQRTKGAAGERELARLLSEKLGRPIRRRLSQCRDGGYDLEPLPVAIEVKRVKSSSGKLGGWWRQTCRQAVLAGKPPVLAVRADRQEWQVYLSHTRYSAPVSVDGLCYFIGCLESHDLGQLPETAAD